MAEAGLQRLLTDLESKNCESIQSAFVTCSSAHGGSVSLTEVPALLADIGVLYDLELGQVAALLDRSSPSAQRVSAVTLTELLAALQSWASSQRNPQAQDGRVSGELTLQELIFDVSKNGSPARSERVAKMPSDSTLERADSPDIVPSEKLQSALDYLSANKDTLRAEYLEKGPSGAAEAFFTKSGLPWNEAVLSRFDSMWLSASTLRTPPPEDEFEDAFVPALSQFITGKQKPEEKDVTQQLIAKLESTIKEVEGIEKTLKLTGQDPSDTRQLLRTLRAQLEQLQKTAKAKKGGKQQFQAKCEKSLHEIYYFYAKQCKMIGKSPSFDEILHSTTTLTMGKFLKFLRDFGVLEAIKPKNKKVIDRDVSV